MSLFSTLLKLHASPRPTEDFFTEVVAHLFRSNASLLTSWLQELGLFAEHTYSDMFVSTQTVFDSVGGLDIANRPDMVINLLDGDKRDCLFIESKIGSGEGFEQLPRYAQVLETQIEAREKALLYITQKYDQKDEKRVTENAPNVRFVQSRWHLFHDFLKSQTASQLVTEVLAFMQEQEMAQRNQFTQEDVLAINHFGNSAQLMDQTILKGEVAAKFRENFGAKPEWGPNKDQLTRLQRRLYYVQLDDDGSKRNWWMGVGYWFGPVENSDYPLVGTWLEVDKRNPHRSELVAAMRQIADNNAEWVAYNLYDPESYPQLARRQSLSHFMAGDDHVYHVQTYFLESIDQVVEMRKLYSHLPWKKT